MDESNSSNDQDNNPTPDNPTPDQDQGTTTPSSDTTDDVASPAENDRLEHSQGGVTTRDDATDLGVPMKPGSPDEPVGPEDALGDGPKRGDYTNSLGDTSYHPHTSERIPDAKPGEAHTRMVSQSPKAEDIGDAEGKGGVTTGQ